MPRVDRESGVREDRTAFQTLWKAVRARKINAVLVWKFDRFARSTKQRIDALEEFAHLAYRQIARKTGIPFGTVSKFLAAQTNSTSKLD